MDFSFMKNLFGKIDFNFGRKNSNGDDIRISGSNNIINSFSQNKIELSKQALRIYEEFKKSNDMFLGISRDEKGIPEISLHPSGTIIENLDLRLVEGNIQELVKYGYLIQVNKEVYQLGK